MTANSYKRNLAAIDWTIKADRPKLLNEAYESKRANFPTPRVVGDYEAYDCPVSGKIIEGRKAHEENLRATGCRLLEPGEKEDNARTASRNAAAQDMKRDAAIDSIVDSVANEYFG
tara:strand:+ start:1129 stop:1476 length:348 start_codon:yes stop_codon:yes gene_type:complete